MNGNETRQVEGGMNREVAAELRVNLIRIISISAFYLIHLWNYPGAKIGNCRFRLHRLGRRYGFFSAPYCGDDALFGVADGCLYRSLFG